MDLRRIVDLAGASLCLLLVSPILPLVAAAIWLTDRETVFHRQARTGLNGRTFTVLKFRSMRINNLPLDHPTEIRHGHPLVTPIGSLIRRFKIDELPQIFNVLRGEMSLIGPRPALPEQVVEYTPYQRRRLEIRPGLTGWAQISGGIEISWPDRILLDVWYVDHRSLWIDALIVLSTFSVIFGGERSNPRRLAQATAYAASREEALRIPQLSRA
ncbi:MAG: sugar transferase [Terracidiphilus sp.]